MKSLLLFLLLTTSAYPHGMNKPGPNNGHIRMIGTIHTELVMGKNSLEVYLLDVGFKNETVKNSNVEAFYLDKNQSSSQVKCTILESHFKCALPIAIKNVQQIRLRVVRDGYAPKEQAEYALPLKFEN